MTVRWKGLIAPTEVPTGDGRMFAAGKLTHRPCPMPLMARFGSGGHENAVPVGTIDRVFDGPGGYWGEGEFLDPAMVPEVVKAIYMIKKKVMGPSVDLDRDFTTAVIPHPLRPDKKANMFNEYNVIGTTLVPMPAFHQVHMSVDDEDQRALLASAGIVVDNWPEVFSTDVPDEGQFDVNEGHWRNWPIAPRDYTFDADDAVKRIAYWAGIGSKQPSIDRYASTFLWRDGNEAGDTLAQDSFRLPLADIINGEPYLIYHAVYSAAALLSGAHGGLPHIPQEDYGQLVAAINEIYAMLAGAFNDPGLKSPFLTRVRPEEMSSELGLDSEDCGCDNVRNVPAMDGVMSFEGDVPDTGVFTMTPKTFAAETVGNTVTVSFNSPVMMVPVPVDVLKSMQEEKRPYGDDGCHFNDDGMCEMCGDPGMHMPDTYAPNTYNAGVTPMKPYGDVLYGDPGYQADGKKRYPLDKESHVRAAWAYINMPKNAAKYSAEHLKMIKDRIRAAAKKYGIDMASYEAEAGQMSVEVAGTDQAALLAGAAPLAPPSSWFADPGLAGPTKLTIGDDGHVVGHLAQWKVCHVGIGNSCVVAPKSRMEYSLFKVGTVHCDDGTQVPVGKITLGTGHANAQWGVMPSREHYDNTGWAAAVVNVGEDRHGIWVNGALTSTMTPERVAEFRAAALSGDWRQVNGSLELIAALAVNNPGFPIYREAGGRAFSLMAVGVLGQEDEMSGEFSMSDETTTNEVDEEQQARLARLATIDEELAAQEKETRLAQLAALDEDAEDLDNSESGKKDRFFMRYNARFTEVPESK